MSVGSESLWDAAMAAEPVPSEEPAPDAIDDALAVMGDFADLKSTYMLGHSRAVAEMAAAAAGAYGHAARRQPLSPPSLARRSRSLTDRQVTQPSSFSNSVMSTATTRRPRFSKTRCVSGALVDMRTVSWSRRTTCAPGSSGTARN